MSPVFPSGCSRKCSLAVNNETGEHMRRHLSQAYLASVSWSSVTVKVLSFMAARSDFRACGLKRHDLQGEHGRAHVQRYGDRLLARQCFFPFAWKSGSLARMFRYPPRLLFVDADRPSEPRGLSWPDLTEVGCASIA